MFSDHFFWLLDANLQSICNEICWSMIFLLFLFTGFKNGFGIFLSKRRYNFGYIILFTVIMAIYSAIQSYFLHGQSLIQGLLPQRFMVGSFLLYFLIMHYLNKDYDYINTLKSVFLSVGYVEMILYIAQYLIIDHMVFLRMPISSRFGEVRMNLGAIGIPFVVFDAINHCLNDRKINYKYIFSLLFGFYYIIVIAKTRLALVAYTIAVLGGFLLWNNKGKKKYICIFVMLIILLLLTKTELFSFLIQGLNNVDLSSQTRALGREFYIKRISEHPLFGCGYINMNNLNAMAYAGVNSISTGIIAWVDLGIYGLAFFFGLIGIVWFVALFYKLLVKSYKIARKGDLTFFMFILFILVISPNSTGFLWYINNTVELVIWICLIEGTYNNIILETAKENN